MSWQTQTRFRSESVVEESGRFSFDGYVDAGWKPPPQLNQMFVELVVGQRFPHVGHACWWAPVDEDVVESVAEQRMSWEGGRQ